jgi:lysophospholipase L1-like esterase
MNMKKRSINMSLFIVSAILILAVALPLAGYLLLTQRGQSRHIARSVIATVKAAVNPTAAPSQPQAQAYPLISRAVPAFASSESYPASNADDDSFDTTWRSHGAPAWLAYDLSGLPTSKRSKLLLVWYNESSNYNHTIIGDFAYNLPQDYTIDVNAAAGGGQAPKTGWVTLVRVRGNHYHSRQHIINGAGYNWVRIDVSAIDGAAQNYDANINMDVFDAGPALLDDWIFYGDSITAGAMGHQVSASGVQAFSQLIHARVARRYPVQEGGGIGYLTSADGVKYMNTWLKLFPGRYVGLSYGTNDALGCISPDAFYNNYVTMVQDVLQAGKIPLVPHIPWARKANIQQCAPSLNARIDALYRAFPRIIRGPDMWTFFQSHQGLISSDDIHPNDAGFGAYRQQWANAIATISTP